MKAIIVDISGKVPEYDEGLCNGLADNNIGKDIYFAAPFDKVKQFKIPTIKLLKFVPRRMPHGVLRRIIKVFEIIINYFYLVHIISKSKPYVIQFEWLPLIEKFGIEELFLKYIKKTSSSSKILLKIHNVFPHECVSNGARTKYIKRFMKVAEICDGFIVHTKTSQSEVSKVFNIDHAKIHVIHHGIFEPQNCIVKDRIIGNNNKLNFLMYGIQTHYKGTDILVKSLGLLPENLKSNINVTIVGMMSEDYFKELSSIYTGVNLIIKPKFIESTDLYKMINDSDIIVLPYRKISQSGVLLLAMHFNRCIITSDLESFKETLDGFDDDWFFHSEDSNSLANLISRYITGKIDTQKQLVTINRLKKKYSWEEAGQLNIQLIMEVVNSQK